MVDLSAFTSAKFGNFNPENWDKFIAALATEFRALEAVASAQTQIADNVNARGLEIVNEALSPIVNSAQDEIDGATAVALSAAASLTQAAQNIGILLEATSSSSVTVAMGNLTFIIDGPSRPTFLAPSFIAAVANDDPNVWVAGTTVSYNKTTGVLVLAVTATRGAGTHSSWTVGLSAAPQLASYTPLSEATVLKDISSGFNGSTTTFALADSGNAPVIPGVVGLCTISLGGVLQNPGTDFTVSTSNITFTTAPATGTKFFGVVLHLGDDGAVNADWNASSGLAEILNKPTLANVATSGSYNDLSNKPTIPAAQVQVDWNASSGLSSIANKPALGIDMVGASSGADGAHGLVPKPVAGNQGKFLKGDGTWAALAVIATSGSYNDLSGTPGAMAGATSGADGATGFVPIPHAGDQNKYLKGDGTWSVPSSGGSGSSPTDLTNSVTTTTVTVNSSTGSSTTIPAATTSSAGAMAAADKSVLAALGTSSTHDVPSTGNASNSQVVLGNDSRLSNARAPTSHAASHAASGSDPISISAGQVSGLSSVATSGAYGDLSGVPTIPNPVAAQVTADISAAFNGTTTAFALKDGSNVAIVPRTTSLCLVILGGVMQNPGTDFTVTGSTITFTTAPATSTKCFIIVLS